MAEAPTLPRRGGEPDQPLPPHVTVPLLSLITQRSLDADYEHVAARRRAAGEPSGADHAGHPGQPAHPAHRRTAGLVLLAFGLLVTVAAVQTSRNASANDASRESLVDQVTLRRHNLSTIQKELSRTEAGVLSLQKSLTNLTTQRQALQARIDRLQARSGFSVARGPGLMLTVNSAPGSAGSQLVRDSDLTLLEDGLWEAGAEGVAVNGQRLTALSAFRNVGIGVLVNSQPINPPYVFTVLGDPDTLPGALLTSTMGAKWYALKNTLGFRFDVGSGGTMTLPAAQPEALRYAQVAPPDSGHTRTQGDSAP